MSKATTSTTSSPFVTAVRSLLSYLPGQSVIKPLADIAFKAFGFTNLSFKIKDSNIEAREVQMVGLYSATILRVRHILAFANSTTRSEAGEIYQGALASYKIAVIKILSLSIAIRNTTPISDKQGNWAAYFRPVKSKSMAALFSTYTYKGILEFSGAKSATAREDLKINISRFPSYWMCGREMELVKNLKKNFFKLYKNKLRSLSLSLVESGRVLG
jgi:hypothetical protein